MTLMTRITAAQERANAAIERTMHDDALEAFRNQYAEQRAIRDAENVGIKNPRCAACNPNLRWDTGFVDSHHGWQHGDPNTVWQDATGEACVYCGVAAIATDRSDFLVCGGHADLRTDRFI